MVQASVKVMIVNSQRKKERSKRISEQAVSGEAHSRDLDCASQRGGLKRSGPQRTVAKQEQQQQQQQEGAATHINNSPDPFRLN
jgi:hypothetical protein